MKRLIIIMISVFSLGLLPSCQRKHSLQEVQVHLLRGGKNGCVPERAFNRKNGDLYLEDYEGVSYLRFDFGYFHPESANENSSSTTNERRIRRLRMKCSQSTVDRWNAVIDSLEGTSDWNEDELDIGICSREIKKHKRVEYFEEGAIFYKKKQVYPPGNYCER